MSVHTRIQRIYSPVAAVQRRTLDAMQQDSMVYTPCMAGVRVSPHPA